MIIITLCEFELPTGVMGLRWCQSIGMPLLRCKPVSVVATLLSSALLCGP